MAAASILKTVLGLGPLIVAATLCGCASAPVPVPTTWVGGDPARLAADRAACHRDTDGIDAGQANDYSNARYGVASALAEAVDRDDPYKDHRGDARAAAFITCMGDKGWHPG